MSEHHEHHEHEKHEHHHHDEYPQHPCDGEGHQHHHHADGSCCCSFHAEEYHGVDKLLLARLIAAIAAYLCGMLLPVSETVEAVLMIAAALIAGYDVLWQAVKNIFRLRFFDDCFLMTFAAVAACILGEFEEGAAVFVLYRIGESCQSFAVRRSRKTIASLTGEAMAHVDENEQISDKLITRFSRVYTPIILALAVLIAVCLPFFGNKSWSDAVYRALSFLVLACPCAIVISVPLAYFAGIGVASRHGIFFHDSAAIDTVSRLGSGEGQELAHVAIGRRHALVWPASDAAEPRSAELILTEGGETFATAIAIARHTRRIIAENILFTIVVKLVVLVLSAFGISRLWVSVFADSGVTLIVVLNSLRAFLMHRKKAVHRNHQA